MRRRSVVAPALLACALAAPARGAENVSSARQRRAPASPVHAAVSGELLVGGKLADLPLTLYGAGAEVGYRLHAPGGSVVFTPFVAGHLMRGHTPAGLLFASASYASGIDVAFARPALTDFHLVGEIGRSDNSLQRATSDTEYEVSQLTGQLLAAITYRTSPWFALRAGFGYRAIGQVGGAVFVVGGTL